MIENNKKTVLIVDDMPENIDVLAGMLSDRYHIKVANQGRKSLAVATDPAPPDIILLDIVMPGMSGYEVCQELKSNIATRHIPVIFVSGKDNPSEQEYGLSLGAVDYIIKPVSPPIVRARIQTHLQLSENQRGLEAQVFSRTSQLNESQAELLRTLARAGEFKDNETGEHVIRMSRYCRLLGLAAGLNEEDADLLMDVAPMHDIGKIGIADSILLHPGKLSAEQMRIIKRHPEIGTKILGTYDCPLLNAARIVTLTHHEKWDGTGYPNNLAGKEIPLFGRIAGIADVFDALTYDRPYKAAWPLERAIEHLNQEAGKHFDPRLVELFNGIIDEVIAVKNMYRG